MKIFRTNLVSISLIVFTSFAFGGQGSGKISQVRLDGTITPTASNPTNVINPSYILLATGSSVTSISSPACATFAPGLAFSFDMSNIQGRAYYAMFLSAQAAGHYVTVSGNGTCNTNSSIENLQWAVKSNF